MQNEPIIPGIPILTGVVNPVDEWAVVPQPQPIIQFKACGPDEVRYGEWKKWLKQEWKPRRRKNRR